MNPPGHQGTFGVTSTILAVVLLSARSAAIQTASAPAESPSSQPASQPAGVLIVEGQVVDHIGAGVRGVEVTVQRVSGEKREELGTATTDQMGDFKLHGRERVHGKLVVRFNKSGFKPHEIEVEAEPDELPPFVDYQMGGALVLSGSVRDSLKDAPIVGARVSARTYADEKSAMTEEAGRFEIVELLPGKIRLLVEAEGFARHQDELEVVENAVPITVRLEPERIVRLLVTDSEGKPIPAVVVESLVAENGDYRTTPTDSDGRIMLRGLGLKTAKLAVRLFHAQFVSSRSFDRTIDLPADQAESLHTLILAPAAVIRGKVVAAADQRPLGGARLTVGESLDEATATAYSDFDGTFTLTGVPPGEAVVTVHLAEFAPALFTVSADPKAPTPLEISLSSASQVHGRVVDPEGKPVADAQVSAARWKGHETLGLRAMTDADGRFTINEAPAEPFTVEVERSGFRTLRGQIVQAGAEEHVLKFAESRRDPEAEPAAGPRAGEEAPSFELTTLEGRKVRLAELKGKWVLLDFWATWCGPCVMEVPGLLAVHKEFGGRKDFEIIGVSLDMDEKALRKFVQDRNIPWVQAFGDEGGARRAAEQFGVMGIPMIYLIGPDGQIVAGGLRGEGISRELRKRLGSQ